MHPLYYVHNYIKKLYT